jgi:carboxypeptidase family protein
MNRNRSTPLSLVRARVLFLPALAVFLAAAVLPGAAQDKKQPLLKTVHGMVLDKSEDAIPGAIVFLKNLQNKTVKSSFSDDGGKYRFSGLDPNTDYEIHAEFKGDVSPTRRLSALDDRKDIYMNLVIPRKK